MTATMSPSVKRALIDHLETLTDVSEALEGVGIGYAWRADLGILSPNGTIDSIFGGGFRFNHTDAVAENRMRPGLLVNESIEVSLYIRVTARPRTSVEATDQRAEAIANAIAAALATNPKVGGVGTFVAISGGAGDYETPDGECSSIWSVALIFDANMSY